MFNNRFFIIVFVSLMIIVGVSGCSGSNGPNPTEVQSTIVAAVNASTTALPVKVVTATKTDTPTATTTPTDTPVNGTKVFNAGMTAAAQTQTKTSTATNTATSTSTATNTNTPTATINAGQSTSAVSTYVAQANGVASSTAQFNNAVDTAANTTLTAVALSATPVPVNTSVAQTAVAGYQNQQVTVVAQSNALTATSVSNVQTAIAATAISAAASATATATPTHIMGTLYGTVTLKHGGYALYIDEGKHTLDATTETFPLYADGTIPVTLQVSIGCEGSMTWNDKTIIFNPSKNDATCMREGSGHFTNVTFTVNKGKKDEEQYTFTFPLK